MPKQAEAVIIPFPARAPAAPGNDRLGKALTALAQALATQQKAVACWRDRLSQLQGSMTNLDHNVHAYAARLCMLRHDIGLLQRQAEQLSHMAELLGEA